MIAAEKAVLLTEDELLQEIAVLKQALLAGVVYGRFTRLVPQWIESLENELEIRQRRNRERWF
jgi:hypothetical protein